MRKRLKPAVIRLAFIAAVLGAFFALTSPALAAPPVLVSASHVDRHPAATWTLPPGVEAQVAEVATSPATSTDGAFFFENVEAYERSRGRADELGLQLPARPRHVLRPHLRARRAVLLRWAMPCSRVLPSLDVGDRAAAAALAPVRGERPNNPPGRNRDHRELDIPRRHTPCPLPQRESPSGRRAELPGLLHARPSTRLHEPADPRGLVGHLAAPGHAGHGRPSLTTSPLPRVHLASWATSRHPRTRPDLPRG